MVTPIEFTVEDLRGLLTELGERLAAEGVHGEIYVVGGAALALEYDERRTTADIDAVLRPETTIRTIAAAMGEERGLPPNWINSSAAAFVPGGDPGTVILDLPGVAVAVAAPEHLLAMKMASYRPGQDQADLELLFTELGIASAEEAADLALTVYGEHTVVLPDRPELLLSAEAILDRLERRRR